MKPPVARTRPPKAHRAAPLTFGVLVAALVALVVPLAAVPAVAATPAASGDTPASALALEAPTGAREQVNFNREWKFARADVPGAQATTFDDSSWSDIALPHNFDMPYDVGGEVGGSEFYVGYGWYRKSFDVPAGWSGKKIEIEFEGVFQVAEIYVNGKPVGTHEGGYSAFHYDITDFVEPGVENEIAVRVDNIWQQALAPRAGDHQFTGGIYRDVYLNVTEPVHVAWYGTFVTAPALTNPAFDPSAKNIDFASFPTQSELDANLAARRSNVSVATEVSNASASATDVSVVHEVKDAEGTVLREFSSSPQTVPAGETKKIDAVTGGKDDVGSMLTGLDLWSPDNPALYSVTTTVVTDSTADGVIGADAEAVDSFDTEFGFRSAQWRNDGFYLNGAKTLLVGANAHQDQGGWGNAVADEGFVRDLTQLKEAGMNLARGAHYPHDPSYTKAADRLGVMVWDEGVFWGFGGKAGINDDAQLRPSDWLKDSYPQRSADWEKFDQSVLTALEAMIRVDRNRPSVINWSVGNEAIFTSNATLGRTKALISRARDLGHQLDPTRKTGMGGAQRQDIDMLSVSDIAGYNGDGGAFKTQCTGPTQTISCRKFAVPSLVSEHNVAGENRPGTFGSAWGFLSTNGTSNEGTKGRQFETGKFTLQPNSAGMALWAGFNHGTIGSAQLSRPGMSDYYRLPKNLWYWYRENRSNWSSLQNVPAVFSTPGTATGMTLALSGVDEGFTDTATLTNDGKQDTQLVVTMRNAAGAWVNESREVTLTVTSGPGVLPGGKSYTFAPGTTMLDGKAAIAFRSYYAGTTTITASSAGLPDKTIQLTTTDTTGGVEGQEPAGFYDSSAWGDVKTDIGPAFAYGASNKALDRPASTSSADPSAPGGNAVDGDEATSWTAATAGSGQTFSVDLEFVQLVYKIRLAFGEATAYPYTIDVRGRTGAWTTVASQTASTLATRPVEEDVEGVYASAVRVTFTGVPDDARASLAELIVYGNEQSFAPAYTTTGVYLSDVADLSAATTASGTVRKDLSIDGGALRVGGVTYAKGVGLAGDSRLSYDLGGKYATISGVAGINDRATGGNALFQILADDTLVYEKTLASGQSDPFAVTVSGARTVTLVTSAEGDATGDNTDWADVRLLGAPRSLTAAGSDIGVEFAGMTSTLRAGSTYRANVAVNNKTDAAIEAKSVLTLRDTAGDVVDTASQTVTVAPDATVPADVALALPTAITGFTATLEVVDAKTGEAISNSAPIGVAADAATVVAWGDKIDGQSANATKTGTWGNYAAGSAAFNGTETYTNAAGDSWSHNFTGRYVRVAAKFDGSKTGADVYIDGQLAGTFSTTVTDGSNTYKLAWTSPRLSDGQHTIKLVSTGKFALDYIQTGADGVQPELPTARTAIGTEVGKAPALPATVSIISGIGRVLDVPVDWDDVTASQFQNPYTSVRVTGKVEVDGASATVSAPVWVVPANLVYLIDTGRVGAAGTSDIVDAARALPGAALLNTAPDRKAGTDDTWGYIERDPATNQKVPVTTGDAGDWATSFIADENDADEGLVYRFTLEPGTYDITAAHVPRRAQAFSSWLNVDNQKIDVKQLSVTQTADQLHPPVYVTHRVTLTERKTVSYETSRPTTSGFNAHVSLIAVSALDVGPDVSASASTRCVAGKVVLTVKATNDDDGPATLAVASAFGSKSFADVPAGQSKTVALSTRAVTVEAGTIDVSATDGAGKKRTVQAQYDARTCG